VGVSCHSGTTSHKTYSGLHSFPIKSPYLSVITSDSKKKDTGLSHKRRDIRSPSLEDIVLDSLQSIDSPWEEIPEDSPSESKPWPDLENPNGKNLHQNIPILDMAIIPQPGGNQLPLRREHFPRGSLRMS